MSHPSGVHRITDEATLRELIGGEPTDVVVSKVADRLGELTRRFVEASTFVCIATARAGTAADGGLDVSPRGDPPGFVHVLDERTLFIPERAHPLRTVGSVPACRSRDARGEGLY